MRPLLESVPNFSEGRRPEVIARLTAAASSVAGAHLLDVHSDPDHNRSVLTIAGEIEAVPEAVFRATAEAVAAIDLRQHRGVHPRIGAVDVIPFVPLQGLPMAVAVQTAHAFGRRIAAAFNLPVYFYEAAALQPAYRRLERVRGRGFEALVNEIEQRPPDAGPLTVHPSAGAVAVGARRPLVAYNIYLNTDRVEIARHIARIIRHSSGGLRYVKALGLLVGGRAQVSMNLTDTRLSAIHTVFCLVRNEAERFGVAITGSEIVGLVPQEAVLDAAAYFLRLHDFSLSQILENRLLEVTDAG